MEPERLFSSSKKIIEDPENEIYVSVASFLEMVIKYDLKKLPLPESPEIFILNTIVELSAKPLDITLAHSLKMHKLPPVHKDPFDRIIISQALAENYPVLTSDKLFKKYKIPLIENF